MYNVQFTYTFLFSDIRRAAFKNWTYRYFIAKYNCIPSTTDFKADEIRGKVIYVNSCTPAASFIESTCKSYRRRQHKL